MEARNRAALAGGSRVVVLRTIGPPLLVLLLAAPVRRAAAQTEDLASVAALVAEHRDAEALAAIDALPPAVREEARVRYLTARLLERLGRRGEAADALAGVEAGLPDALATPTRRRRAELLARSGRCAEARPLLEELGRSSGTMRALAGECALAVGEPDEAARRLAAVAREDPRHVDTFAVRMMLAEAHHAAGRTDAAIAELRSVLVARPDHEDVARVAEQLVALGAPPRFEPEEHIARAERLFEVNRHEDAIVELDAAGRPAARDALRRWLHLRGMALFKTRHRYAEAAQVLTEASRLGGPTSIDDEFHAARALGRADRDRDAVAAYRRLVRRHPRHARAADAEFLASWLELRHGYRGGEARMRRFLSGGRASGERARDATWQLAFGDFEADRLTAAVAGFERYARMGEGAMIEGRGLYWLGRAHARLGARAAAVAAWSRVVSIEPLHWYALLARQRLVEVGADPGPPVPPAAEEVPAPPTLTPALPVEVSFFAALGLLQDAVDALGRAERAVRDAAPDGREREALVRAYGALGDPGRAYRLVAVPERDALRRAPTPATRWAWDAAYPRPWPTDVEAAAREHGLRAEYLYAIMRQESGYDPDAISYADALGLLQMLPSTARRLAPRLGVAYSRDLLFDPAWNARFAAAENTALVRRFGVPLCIAAYNAGGPAVERWLEHTGEVELDRFVERIPVDQTRDYIRRVTSHYARYLWLSNPAGGWPLELPARVSPRAAPEAAGR